MKRIFFAVFSAVLIFSLCACSGTPVKPNKTSKQSVSQTGGVSQRQLKYENNSFNIPVTKAYQTKAYRKTGPFLGLNFKKLIGSYRFNINEAISDNIAALIVIFAVLLVVGFVIFQNRRSVRKGSYR